MLIDGLIRVRDIKIPALGDSRGFREASAA